MIYILITTSHCSKCPGFKKELEDMGFFKDYKGDVIDENHEMFSDISEWYKIQSAPTILLFDEKTILDRITDEEIPPIELFRTSEIYELSQFLKGLDKESKDSV